MIRRIIREELRKMRLDERKKGHDTVIKIAKTVRSEFVKKFVTYCKKHKHILAELDSHYENYLAAKSELTRKGFDEDSLEQMELDVERFKIDSDSQMGSLFALLLVRFYDPIELTSIKTNVELVPIVLSLIAKDGGRNLGGYQSNEVRRNSFGGNTSKIVLQFDLSHLYDFMVNKEMPLKKRAYDLIQSRFSILVHEVQHYYDDMRDNEFTTTRNQGYDITNHTAYYTHPKEINTFFTQAAHKIDLANLKWNKVQKLFFDDKNIRNVIYYNRLNPKVKKEYLKRLYTLWSQTNAEMNKNTKRKR